MNFKKTDLTKRDSCLDIFDSRSSFQCVFICLDDDDLLSDCYRRVPDLRVLYVLTHFSHLLFQAGPIITSTLQRR